MRSETANTYYERMHTVLRYIQDHLDGDLGPSTLAAVANFSPSHFHRVFKGMLGESLKAHVRRLRLERAALQLEMSQRPVIDIGLEAGFETPETFSRAFKKMFDAAPSLYRVEKRKSRWAFAPSSVHYLPEDARTGITLRPRRTQVNVEIMKSDGVRVAYIRHIGPYFECAVAWEKICAWAGPKGLMTPETGFYGVCHDDPKVTPPEKLRMDVCLSVPGSVEAEGEVGVMDIFQGEYAMTLHKGPYEGLAETYETLFGVAMPETGREFADGPSIERYLNTPENTAPEDLLTEIFIPLK